MGTLDLPNEGCKTHCGYDREYRNDIYALNTLVNTLRMEVTVKFPNWKHVGHKVLSYYIVSVDIRIMYLPWRGVTISIFDGIDIAH